MQQRTSADDIFKCFFFLGALRVNFVKITPAYCMLKHFHQMKPTQSVGQILKSKANFFLHNYESWVLIF